MFSVFACSYIAGRKTLAQVFAEYDMEIAAATRSRFGSSSKVGVDNLLFSSSTTENSGAKTSEPSDSSKSTPPPSSGDENRHEPPSNNRVARLKAAVRDYGSTVVVFHVGISLASLGIFYTLVARLAANITSVVVIFIC